MKGDKDEKSMGPMFPRLHLSDAEKGGPRAPPRNKMALYEQLSIPSQRFKSGVVPVNTNDGANMTPPASVQGNSQSSSQQRGGLFSVQLPASRQAAEQVVHRLFDSKVPLVQPQSEKKSEEDDFRVPVFMQTNVHEDFNRCRSNNREKSSRSSQALSLHSAGHVPMDGNETSIVPTNTQEAQSCNNGENVEEFMGNSQRLVQAVSNSSSIKLGEISGRRRDTYARGEQGNDAVSNKRKLLNADPSSLSQQKGEGQFTSRVLRGVASNEPARGVNNGNNYVLEQEFGPEKQRSIDNIESHKDRTCGSVPVENADAGDRTSESSMVDCIAGFVISPDDVVGIIGQKHFWKARRAIANQQRVFSVQVFELHRLIKVQKLMAGSQDILPDSSFLGKPIKSTPAKEIHLDCIVKRPLDAVKPQDGSEKRNHRMEGSAENIIGKESLSTVQNAGQMPSSKPVSVNSSMTSIPNNPAMGSWGSDQGQQQWLIPVMSPFEGLVYKPYPIPGYTAPFCGGCGPPVAPPMAGNFVSPAYGVSPCHQFQQMAVPPFASHAGPQGYFPPYSIPVMNHSAADSAADHQTNHCATSDLRVQTPGLEVNHNGQYQQTSKSSHQRDEVHVTTPMVRKLHEPRDSEVQASTASSPSERGQGTGKGNSSGGSNVLSLFPTSPLIDTPSCNLRPQHVDRPAGVIKVVPHGGISATESAARIFQSIQQERRLYDV